jgi:hypothetical protein
MRRHAHGVMDRAMMCDERLDPRGKREHTAFGWLPSRGPLPSIMRRWPCQSLFALVRLVSKT